jgi:hypothetical protein
MKKTNRLYAINDPLFRKKLSFIISGGCPGPATGWFQKLMKRDGDMIKNG